MTCEAASPVSSIFPREYFDFARLYLLHQAGAFFVTRAKTNIDTRRLYSAPSDRANGIICDQTIVLAGIQTNQLYPEHLRRIRFKDPETGKTLVFLTNQRMLSATTICALYKYRWYVELFFYVDQTALADLEVLWDLGSQTKRATRQQLGKGNADLLLASRH